MFRLAVAQAPADLVGPIARLEWLHSKLLAIVDQGADMVLCPELFACGYNIGANVQTFAEDRGGPICTTLSQMAKTHGIAIHCGYVERDARALYNAAICVAPDGATLGHHRKLAIPPGFERDHFAAGQGCALFTYKGLKIATLICYDAEFSETVRHVTTLGAELVLVPTALGAKWSWVADTMIPTRAYENGVYLAYANSAGTENGMEFLGRSVIAAPNGTEAARAGTAPDIIYADIDPENVSAAQTRLPYLQDCKTLQL
jgi:nitrilase